MASWARSTSSSIATFTFGAMSKIVDRLAVAPRARPPRAGSELAHVLGGEEGGQPAVGDLAGELCVLGPDRRDVDRDPLLHRRDRELQRLARPVGEREGVQLAVELELLARQRLAHDGDVLARALELPGERLAVPALRHLRPGGPDAQQHPPAGDVVESRRGHGRHRGSPAGDLEDRRAELDPLGVGRQPRQHGGGVRAVGLGGPDRVKARATPPPARSRAAARRSARVPNNPREAPTAMQLPFQPEDRP